MKRKILSVIIAGAATCAFGQSLILTDGGNLGGLGATSSGLVYINTGGGAVLFDGYNYNLGVTVMGGASSSSLSAMGTYYPGNNPGGTYTGLDVGAFVLGTSGYGVAVPGVAAGGTAWIQLQFWDYDDPSATGTFTSYAAAVAGKDWVATVLFTNPTSNPTATPPTTPVGLVGMPSLILVPEPTTLALAGLGLASLLVLRRKA